MAKKISQLEFVDILTGDELVVLSRPEIGDYKLKVKDIKALFSKVDFGLANVDNTSDVNKPISTATAAALANKSDFNHTHEITGINGLFSALANKSQVGHVHISSEVTGLLDALAAKAALVHNHGINDINGLTTELANKASVSHLHNVSDINGLTDTLTSINGTIAGKAAIAHSHEIININGLIAQLASKANAVHVHNATEIQGLQSFVQNVIVQSGNGSSDVAVGALDW